MKRILFALIALCFANVAQATNTLEWGIDRSTNPPTVCAFNTSKNCAPTGTLTDSGVYSLDASKCAFIPTDAGGVSKGCNVNFEAGRTVLNFGAVADGNTTQTDNNAAFEAAALSGQIEIPQGYFYTKCSIRITNVSAAIHGKGPGQSIVYFGSKSSAVNTTTSQMDLSVCPGRSTTLGGSALAKFGYTAGTYTALDNIGTVLGTGINALTPLNTLVSPFVAGDAITVNGGTITVVGAHPHGAVTVTIASPGVITFANHGLVANQQVVFSSNGALPTGISAAVMYYVVGASITTNTFQISATINGAAINTSGTQSGTQTFIAPSAANQMELTDPLWRLWDEVDTLACNGMLFCVDNTDPAAGYFRVFKADNFEVLAVLANNQAGRVFDIEYPPAQSFAYSQSQITNVHVKDGVVVPSFRAFAKISNVWFGQFTENYFVGTPVVPRNDGSYFYHFSGGNFASIGTEISGEYSNATYGIIASGYIEGIHIRQRTEFVGVSTGLLVPSNVPLGGAATSFAAQALWWENWEINTTSQGINITNVMDTKGRVHIGEFGLFDPNWIGFVADTCQGCKADLVVGGSAPNAVGLILSGPTTNGWFNLTAQGLNTDFSLTAGTNFNYIEGQSQCCGGHPDTFVNLSGTNTINWRQVTSPVLSACGTTPALSANATDKYGTITEGTTATGCVLTFVMAKTNAPVCTVVSPTGAAITSYATASGAAGAATLTIVNASATGNKYSYTCQGS